MTIEAMKQALEALESATPKYTRQRADQKTLGGALDYWKLEQHQRLKAITSLRQAIAEAEKQEPVAWQVHPFDYSIGHEGVYARTDRLEQVEAWKRKGWNVQPLYTHPQPKREPLTDEQIAEFFGVKAVDESFVDFVRAIEAAHGIKEKNT